MSRVRKFINVLLIVFILIPLVASAPPAKKAEAAQLPWDQYPSSWKNWTWGDATILTNDRGGEVVGNTGTFGNDWPYYTFETSRENSFGRTTFFSVIISKDFKTKKAYTHDTSQICAGVGCEKNWKFFGDINLKTTNATPKPINYIKNGMIAGKVVKSKTAEWLNDPATIFPGKEVELATSLLVETGEARTIENENGAFVYQPFDLSHIKINDTFDIYGLMPGEYNLRVSFKEKIKDCGLSAKVLEYASGNSDLCNANYDGQTTFNIAEDNGNITIKVTSPYKKTITIKPGDSQDKIKNNGIDIQVNEKTYSPFDMALENGIKILLSFTNVVITRLAGWINLILFKGNDIGNAQTNPGLAEVWTQVRNLTLSLLTLGLLIIAFANVLSIDLERYGITRLIPKLVIAIVMTYFSFLIIRFLLELTSAFQVGLLSGQGLAMENFANINSALTNGEGLEIASHFGEMILLVLLFFALIVAMLYLFFVLIIRIMVLWFLVAVAPLAFMMQVMPFTEFLYNQWWQRFWKWAFMGPAVAFMIWLFHKLITGAYTGVMFGATSANPQNANSWIILLMATAAIFIAAALPMMMGGDIISAVAGGIKKYGQHAPGVKHAQQFWQQRKDAGVERRKKQMMTARARLAGGKGVMGWAGRRAAGADKVQARKLEDATISFYQEQYEGMNKEEKNAKIGDLKPGSLSERGMMRAMLKQDHVGTDEKNEATRAAFEREINKPEGEQDQVILGALKKDHPGGIAKIADLSKNTDPKSKPHEMADKSIEKTKVSDMKTDMIDYMLHHNQELLREVMGRDGFNRSVQRATPEVQRKFAEAANALRQAAENLNRPREDMGRNPDGTPRNFGEH